VASPVGERGARAFRAGGCGATKYHHDSERPGSDRRIPNLRRSQFANTGLIAISEMSCSPVSCCHSLSTTAPTSVAIALLRRSTWPFSIRYSTAGEQLLASMRSLLCVMSQKVRGITVLRQLASMMRKSRTADSGYRSDCTIFPKCGDLLFVRLVSHSPSFPFPKLRATIQIDFPHNHGETRQGTRHQELAEFQIDPESPARHFATRVAGGDLRSYQGRINS
jgi:hypothetical protein